MQAQERRVGDWVADRYEIFDIHTGGMGVVYIAYDHQGNSGQRVLALKSLRDEFLRDRRSIARFTTECNAWIRLDRHPNIVRAYSVQELEGKPHAVLELVTGGDLRRWIGTPRLDLRQALRFGIQFCLGMEHATQKGLHCHRDIKPENLLISDGGTLKITDFGLAKVRDEAGPVGEADSEPIPLVGLEETLPPRDPAAAAPRQAAGAGPRPGLRPPGGSSWTSPPPSPAETIDHLPAGLGGGYDDDEGPIRPAAFAPGPGWRPGTPGSSESSAPTLDYDPADRAGPFQGIPLASGSNFGARGGAPAPAGAPDRGGITRVGVMLGTGPYMAPEQFRDAKAVDMRADIYSFGIVLFEMIVGHRPFQADTYEKLARQHEKVEPPSIARYVPSRHSRIARPLDRIVQRCLAKQPAKRFASYLELRRALDRCLWHVARERIAPPTETELEAWELTNKGVSLGTLGRHDEERQGYEDAIRIKPDYVAAWFNQAAALGDSGHPEEAVEFADVALHLNPRSVPALMNKALALNALGRPDQALELFSAAAHLEPRDPEVWYGRGFVLLSLGNIEGAKSALDQALRLRPLYPEALYALGVALSRSAPWDEAEAFFARAGDRASALAINAYNHTGSLPNLQKVPWVRRTEDSAPEVAGND